MYFRDHSELITALVRPLRAQADAARRDLTEPVIDAAVRAISPIAADPGPERLRATVRALVTMNQRATLPRGPRAEPPRGSA